MNGYSTIERAGRRRDALAALAVDRERVADDGRDTERERAGPTADRHARARCDRALREIAQEHDGARAPSEEPRHVRGARISRPLLQDVATVGPGDELRARERPEQPGEGNAQGDYEHVPPILPPARVGLRLALDGTEC